MAEGETGGPPSLKERDVRIAILASLALAMLLAIQFRCLAQEAPAPEKTPLQIVEESLRAIESGDFSTYVDHLTEEEQKVQAGLALLLWATVSPSMEEAFERVDPQELLLLRALNDVVIEHSASPTNEGESPTARAMRLAAEIQGLFSAPATSSAGYSSGYSYSGYAPAPTTGPTRVYDLLQKPAGTLKDPRAFLIVVLTELSRPTVIDGAPATSPENEVLAGMVKAYREQKWSLYVRGNYAVAASSTSAVKAPTEGETEASKASAPQPPAKSGLLDPPEFDPYNDAPASAPFQPTSVAPRIEFQKIGGVWKISHIAQISGSANLSGMTAQTCVGGNCVPASSMPQAYLSPSPGYLPSGSLTPIPASSR